MSFNEVIGHEKQILFLKKGIKNKKISHALIFEGIEGIGKFKIASSFAKATFCNNKELDSCDNCSSCLKFEHHNHPDFMIIEAETNTIKNAQIEEFQKFAMLKPYDGLYKIVIINDAEKMNASSQNRILKILEEPPEHVIIIMITNNSELLLNTVVSRSQVIKFNGLKEDELKQYIIDKYEIDSEEAGLISRLSVGSLEKTKDYLDSDIFKNINISIIDLLKAIDQKQGSKVLELLPFFISNKENIIKILDYMIIWYRDILLFKKVKTKDLLVHLNELELIKKLCRKLSVKKIISNIEIIEKTKQKIIKHGNYELTIEVMLLGLLEE